MSGIETLRYVAVYSSSTTGETGGSGGPALRSVITADSLEPSLL